RDVPPAVKVAIGAMIARLQRVGGEAGRAVDDMAGVVEVPVRAEDPALGGERLVEAGPGIGRLDVEGGGGDSVAYRPVDGAVEHVRPVLVHSEDEGAVDHDAEITEAPRHRRIVAGEVLLLVACPEVRRVEGFEADEERPQTRLRRALYKVAAKHGIDGGGALEEASHAAHPLEQGLGEAAVAEQMVVEKIEVAAGQPIDLGEGGVDPLGVEASSAGEEGVLVAEVAMLWAAAGDDDRIGNEVELAADEVAADGRYALKRSPGGGDVSLLG